MLELYYIGDIPMECSPMLANTFCPVGKRVGCADTPFPRRQKVLAREVSSVYNGKYIGREDGRRGTGSTFSVALSEVFNTGKRGVNICCRSDKISWIAWARQVPFIGIEQSTGRAKLLGEARLA